MKHKPANWIAFYHRLGEEISLQFYFHGEPTLANVVSKIRKHPQDVAFVLPYMPAATTPQAKAHAFLNINGITGLVYTPMIGGDADTK